MDGLQQKECRQADARQYKYSSRRILLFHKCIDLYFHLPAAPNKKTRKTILSELFCAPQILCTKATYFDMYLRLDLVYQHNRKKARGKFNFAKFIFAPAK
ncbi:MAG: hypothetical protein K2O45_17575 [Oscillospiraceae bacterium]|nr:hypothetical protein [Oscillospiraceae bacterium]